MFLHDFVSLRCTLSDRAMTLLYGIASICVRFCLINHQANYC